MVGGGLRLTRAYRLGLIRGARRSPTGAVNTNTTRLERGNSENGGRGIRTPKSLRTPVFKTGAIAILPALQRHAVYPAPRAEVNPLGTRGVSRRTSPPGHASRTACPASLYAKPLQRSRFKALYRSGCDCWMCDHTSYQQPAEDRFQHFNATYHDA